MIKPKEKHKPRKPGGEKPGMIILGQDPKDISKTVEAGPQRPLRPHDSDAGGRLPVLQLLR